jgi:hypothetical protein
MSSYYLKNKEKMNENAMKRYNEKKNDIEYILNREQYMKNYYLKKLKTKRTDKLLKIKENREPEFPFLEQPDINPFRLVFD